MEKKLNINGENLLLFKNEKSDEIILNAFWQWIEYLDREDYLKAVESIYWNNGRAISPKDFKARVTTFFQIDGKPLEVVSPCQELKKMIEDVIEIEWENFHKPTKNHVGWCMLKIPVTNDKTEAKISTNAGLWAVAASFFIREIQGKLAFEFEIFQL